MPLIIRTIFYDSHSLDTSGHRLSQHWSIETYAKAVMKNPRDCFKAFDDFHLHCEGCSHNIYAMRGSVIVALWNEERSKYYFRLLTEMTATEYDTYMEKLCYARGENTRQNPPCQPTYSWDEEDMVDNYVPEEENRSASRRASQVNMADAVVETTSATGADGITITSTRSTFGRSPLRGYSYSMGVDPSMENEPPCEVIDPSECDNMRMGSAPDGGF